MFAIGEKDWPGISKLVEECGEVLQVCGKLIATSGQEQHWDGQDLREALQNEMADLKAALIFVCNACELDGPTMDERAAKKLARFMRWHELGLTNEAGK